MNPYFDLFPMLGLPDAARAIAFRTLEVPFYTDTPFDGYGFVPALVPLWATDSPAYTGYWKHWFTPLRQPVFVEVALESGAKAEEIARSFEQMAQRLVFTAIIMEETPTPAVQAFAAAVGLGPAEVETLAALHKTSPNKTGPSEALLLSLPAFAADPPLCCLSPDAAQYRGDFPHDSMVLTEQAVRRLCTFEVSDTLCRRIRTLPFAPPWFTQTDQRAVFDRLLQEGDLSGAWLSLNSTGWRYLDAKDALGRLADRAEKPDFSLLASAWIAEPHEKTSLSPESAAY